MPGKDNMRDPIQHDPSQGRLPTSETYVDEGAISRLGEVLRARRARSVFVVYDRDAYAACGAEAMMEPQLEGYTVARFADFTANPRLEDIQAGARQFLAAPCDVIVSIGGGSALDVAKMISIFAGNEHIAAEKIVRQEATIERRGPPVIAIPTTSGTGAQVTRFSALYVAGVKYSVSHPLVLPAVAIVDPMLTYSMSAALTASTGVDAFAQGLESMWAVGSTEQSQEYATEAVRLALRHLPKAVRDPCPDSRRGMALAAHLAGQAIDISKTTAAHALSYTFTSEYGVPHGQAVGLTLGPILAYNAVVTEEDCVDRRGRQHVLQALDRVLGVLDCADAEAGQARITSLLRGVNCPTRLSEVGVKTAEQRAAIAAKVNVERMSNNPRQLDGPALRSLLAGIA
jgi:alcohol dehydrogenase class IV